MRPSCLAVLFALIVLSFSAQARAADPAAGERVFKLQCGACHAVVPGRNLVGPSLFGVVGRSSGAIVGFHYSAASTAAHLTWDEATLDKYLANPRQALPGTSMPYAGLRNDDQRADVIAYLATLK